MDRFPPLETFGNRIMVCGPSNAGKSTFALALGAKLGVPHIHLDQLHHLPNTDWQPRPPEEFAALHEAAIACDSWVMDGNYTRLFPSRLPRATGAILLHSNRFASLARYFRRTLFEHDRAGGLSGNRDSIKWQMIHWILAGAPKRQDLMTDLLRAAPLPLLEIRNMRDLNRLYTEWGLTRVSAGHPQ